MPTSRLSVYDPTNCSYFRRVRHSGDGTTNCQFRASYDDARSCWGCGERRLTVTADPQVLLNEAREAFLALNRAIDNVRSISGRPQSARATLARSNEVISMINDDLIPMVIRSF